MIKVAALTLFSTLSWLAVIQADAAIYARYVWQFNGWSPDTSSATYAICQTVPGDPPCPAAPGVAMMPINKSAPVAYTIFGRVSGGLAIAPSTGGYLINLTQNNSTTYGFAWMAFVRLDQFVTSPQSLLWSEGQDSQSGQYKAGFTITISPSGFITAQVGHNGAWTYHLGSANKIGLKAWHHVALVWDTNTYYLLIDGVLQSSVASSFPPDESPQVPVAVGSYHFAGNPKFFLQGSVDEVKFIKFTPGSFVTSGDAPRPGASGNFVLNEAGLELRKTVLADMTAKGVIAPGSADVFATPTFQATATLRAYVNSFFNSTMASAPLETFAGFASPYENYVFPMAGVDVLGNSPPSANYSLFERMRTATTYGYCEAAAMTLWAVYKSFGYAARKYDWMSGPNDFQYANSHALTEVYTYDSVAGITQYVMQDPTYNISGRDTSTVPVAYRNVMDLYGMQATPPASMPFSNNGYSYNPSPIWTVPTAPSGYFFYFNSPTTIFNSWTQ